MRDERVPRSDRWTWGRGIRSRCCASGTAGRGLAAGARGSTGRPSGPNRRTGRAGPRASRSGRPYKKRLVREGKAHAALVLDGDAAVGWCQFGSPAELPGIAHKKDYEAGLPALPDYRITCFFVDRAYRRRGQWPRPPWTERLS